MREGGVGARVAGVVSLGDPHLVSDEDVLEGASVVTGEHDGRVLSALDALSGGQHSRFAYNSSCALHNIVIPAEKKSKF